MSNLYITIGREFGSGGREIGKKVAKALNIPYYDKELSSSRAMTKSPPTASSILWSWAIRG